MVLVVRRFIRRDVNVERVGIIGKLALDKGMRMIYIREFGGSVTINEDMINASIRK